MKMKRGRIGNGDVTLTLSEEIWTACVYTRNRQAEAAYRGGITVRWSHLNHYLEAELLVFLLLLISPERARCWSSAAQLVLLVSSNRVAWWWACNGVPK